MLRNKSSIILANRHQCKQGIIALPLVTILAEEEIITELRRQLSPFMLCFTFLVAYFMFPAENYIKHQPWICCAFRVSLQETLKSTASSADENSGGRFFLQQEAMTRDGGTAARSVGSHTSLFPAQPHLPVIRGTSANTDESPPLRFSYFTQANSRNHYPT